MPEVQAVGWVRHSFSRFCDIYDLTPGALGGFGGAGGEGSFPAPGVPGQPTPGMLHCFPWTPHIDLLKLLTLGLRQPTRKQIRLPFLAG